MANNYFDAIFDLVYPRKETNNLLMNEKPTETTVDRMIIPTAVLNKRLKEFEELQALRKNQDPEPTSITTDIERPTRNMR